MKIIFFEFYNVRSTLFLFDRLCSKYVNGNQLRKGLLGKPIYHSIFFKEKGHYSTHRIHSFLEGGKMTRIAVLMREKEDARAKT